MNPTVEQQSAIAFQGRRFTIQASAGSGKTGVLVQRYLRHVIEQGWKPDEILTITFTRKAAAEMKERVLRALMAAGRPDDAQLAETGPIQTIHSFCERVLRENALLTEVDPDFTILGSAEHASRERTAIRLAAIAATEAGGYGAAVVARLAGQPIKRISSGGDEALSGAVQQFLSAARPSGLSPEEWLARHESPLSLAREQMALALEGREWSAPVIADWQSLINSAKEAWGRRLPDWLARLKPDQLESQCEDTCGVVELGCLAWELLDRGMVEDQAFDFTLLEALATRALAEKPVLAARVRRQFKAILVDESQDVNPQQYRLVDALGLESEMMVGDPQQSIYAFRGADRALFVERTKELDTLPLSRNFRSTPGILAFVDHIFGKVWGESYKPMKAPEPAPGDSLFGSETPDEPWDGVEFWPSSGGQLDPALVARGIRKLVDEGTGPGEIAILVRRAEAAARIAPILERLGIQARIAGGTEHFYTRMEVRDLANALTALADHTDRHAWLAFLRSPFIGLSLDTLVLAGPGGAAGPEVLGVVPRLEEDAPKIERMMFWLPDLLEMRDRLSAWEMIAQLLARSPLLPELARRPRGRQMIANVRKLQRMAASRPELGPKEYADEIRSVQRLQHKEGEAPSHDDQAGAVTLMTIHKAKGLEFHTVVLADAGGGFKNTGNVVVDPKAGAASVRLRTEKGGPFDWMQREKSGLDRQEEERVLYVALTRARRRLCVVVNPAQDNKTMAGLIARMANFPETRQQGLVVWPDAPEGSGALPQ